MGSLTYLELGWKRVNKFGSGKKVLANSNFSFTFSELKQ